MTMKRKGASTSFTSKKKRKQPKLGSGARFKKLSGSVAKNYEKKGMSAKKAEAIGAAVAAKQGRKKYGAKKMASLAAKGKSKK